MTKPFLIITGMHRSGTSFLARALNLSGTYLGELESLTSHDWKFSKDNVRGHWESKEFLKLTNKTLSINDGSWDNPPKKTTLNISLKKKIPKTVKELMVHESFAAGFKDPRIIPCLDSWWKVLPRNSIIIGIYRNPLKVAESIKIRDGFEYEKSIELWKFYNEKLLNYLEEHDGFLLNFDWPKKRLMSELKLIIKKIGLNENSDLDDWFSKKIQKANKPSQADFLLTSDITNLYSRLNKRSKLNSKIKIKKITRTSKEFERIIQNLLNENKSQGKYFKKIIQEHLNLIKNIREKKPLSSLISIYSERPDLQDVFPEVLDGNYAGLVNWAVDVCEGKVKGEKRFQEILSKFLSQYKTYQTKSRMEDTNQTEIIYKSNPVSALLFRYYKRPDLQKAYPEASKGNFWNLFKWAIDVCEGKIEEEKESKTVLSKFLPWYKEFLPNYQKINELKIKIDSLSKQKEVNEEVIKDLKNENKNFSEDLERLQDENSTILFHSSELRLQIQELSREIALIKNSISFKTSRTLASKLDKILPDLTKRGKIKRKIISQMYKESIPQREQKNITTSFDEKLYLKTEIAAFSWKPKISIIMPVYNVPIEYLKIAVKSVMNQTYENWELCICDDNSNKQEILQFLREINSQNNRIKVIFSESNEGITKASNKALTIASGDYIMFLDNDDELSPSACFEIVKLLNQDRNIDYIYTDEDKINKNGNYSDSFYKPDWSPDLILSVNYAIHCCVFRRTLLNQLGGFRDGFEGSQDHDLILRFTEKTNKIAHIPKVLYHWRTLAGSSAKTEFAKSYAYSSGIKAINEALKRRGLEGECLEGTHPGTFRVKYSIKDNPLVSIIIPTKTIGNVEKCLNSIFSISTYKNFEVILVDDSESNEITQFAEKYENVDSYKSPVTEFNFSEINNFGVTKAKGNFIIFLNDDTEVIEPSWIEELLGPFQRDSVGIVGAKLLYPDKTIQHAGTIVGIQGYAGNFGKMPNEDPHYFALQKMIRNVSAVTAACMMIRKKLFEEIGGFDKNLARAWQDVDLCLAVRKRDKYVVYTPFSLLYHYEGGTRGQKDMSKDELDARSLFRSKNIQVIQKGDPFYNPNLSLSEPYVPELQFPQISDPIELLIKIYYHRQDLQKQFPEVSRGQNQKLIDWAATFGVTKDMYRRNLLRFNSYYAQNSSVEKKDLAKAILNFNGDSLLQEKNPEVFDGNFKNILKLIPIQTGYNFGKSF